MRFRRNFFVATVLLWICLAAQAAPRTVRNRTAPASGKNSAAAFSKEIQPLIQRYCFDCHGEKKKGDLDLRGYTNATEVLAHRHVWAIVLKNLQAGEMPPKNKTQPATAERARLVEWIEAALYNIDCDHPDPGRVTIRRLNRAEYNNTIRDLVGVDFQPADDFPADDSGYGFDNIGDAMSLPPVLFEKYLAAAEKILAKALDPLSPSAGATAKHPGRFPADRMEGSAPGESLEGGARMLAREGDIFFDHEFPARGEYVLRVRAYGQQAGPEAVKMAVSLDGNDLRKFDVKTEESSPGSYEVAAPVRKGRHRISIAYLNNYVNPDDPDPRNRDRNLIVEYIEVLPVSPSEANSASSASAPASKLDLRPDTFSRIFFHPPGSTPAEKRAAAKEIFQRFAKLAFRRPPHVNEIDRLLKLYGLGVDSGESFEGAVRLSLQAILVSPHFLFRGELQPQPDDPATIHPIDDHSLASRLSYFLWSTMPDAQLTALADRGTLRRNLDSQIRRMLVDPKARALVDNFAGQWLQLRNLKIVSPDAWEFPEFDEPLRAAMQRETELFFESILREDRSMLELLQADYTFVNDRLALHYGLAGIAGSEFQKVALKGTHRGGILTHASILTLTSNPTRTSPVKRGKWILENILGTPPPPPPAAVPELSETKEVKLSGTLRQRTEQHRADPNCATCHNRMDPIGFAFEHFNAIGGWRSSDGKFPIEPAGELASGEKFSSSDELLALLAVSKRNEFLRCITEKMLTYALGRGLEYSDKCAVDSILQALAKNNHRFSALVVAIAKSIPFDRRRGDAFGHQTAQATNASSSLQNR